MAKQLNVNLAFTADTGKAKAQLQDLQNQLTKIATTGSSFGELKIDSTSLNAAVKSAAELKVHLDKAVNLKTGNLDFSKLSDSLRQSGKTLNDYSLELQKLGPAGQKAFLSLTDSVINAEVPLKRSNAMLTEMWTTLKNTARWQISSSILHGFMGSVQSAYGYAQDLNESLNNIRIVTGQSVDDMARFAEQANKAAKALSTTTTEYTNASLIYYQQGLSDAEVQQRTDITIKMANVARQSAEVVSDQMTAVWNNFYDGSKSLEYYADVMTALGAATASSTDEIAGGLEKFAAIGETIGLSYEYAASALATITSNTRQSEEVVGTALKTIFARIQGLNLGETLDDGTTLNKYSEALEKVGISIFDQQGELKNMDTLLDEMASKWETLDKAQQTALAQTVAGVRQYTQLIALMENWNNGDNDSMMANLNTARTAEGALDEQADIYAESWEAARDRVTAAAEEIYAKILDDDFFIGFLDGIGVALDGVSNLIDNFGGLSGVLISLGALATKIFKDQISQSLRDMAYNMRMATQSGRDAIAKEKSDFISNAVNSLSVNQDYETTDDIARKDVLKQQLTLQQQLMDNADKMSDFELETNKILIDRTKILGEQKIAAAKNLEAAKEDRDSVSYQGRLQITQTAIDNNNTGNLKLILKQYEKYGEKIQKSFQIKTTLPDQIRSMIKEGQSFDKILDELKKSAEQLDDTRFTELVNSLNMADLEGEDLDATIDKLVLSLNGIRDVSENSLISLGVDPQTAQQLVEAYQRVASATEQNKQKNDQYKQSVDGVTNSIKTAKGVQLDWANGLTATANMISSTVSAINTVIGTFNTLNNPDASGWEKFSAVLIGVTTVITMLTTAYTKQNLASAATLVSTVANSLGFTGLAASASAASAALTGATVGVMGFGTALWTALWPIGLVVAAVAGLVAGIIALVKWLNEPTDAEKNLAKLEEASVRAKDAIEETTQAANELKSAFDNYNSVYETFENCTRGTKEWYDALQALNLEVQNLITSFPELKQYLEIDPETGALTISKEGWEQAQAEANRRVNASILNDSIITQEKAKSKVEINSEELDDRLLEEAFVHWENNSYKAFNNAIDNDKIKGGAVYKQQDLQTLMEEYENQIRQTAVEWANRASSNLDISSAEWQENYKQGLMSTGYYTVNKSGDIVVDEYSVKALEDTFSAALDVYGDYVDSISSFNLETQTALTTLTGIFFSGEENLSEAEKRLAAIDLQAEAKQKEEDYKKEGKTQAQIWADYEKAKGIDGTFVEEITKDGKKAYKYKDANNIEQTVLLSDIYSTISTYLATESTSDNVANAQKAWNNMTEGAQKAMESYLMTGTLAGLKQSELQEMDAQGLKNLFGDNFSEEDIATYFGTSTIGEAAERWNSLVNDAVGGFETVGNLLSETPKQYFDALKDNGNLSEASLLEQIDLSNMLQEVFNKSGIEGLDNLTKILGESGEYADEFATVLDDIDWDNISAEELAVKLEEAGVATDLETDSLGFLIAAMQDTTDATNSLATAQQGYASLQEMGNLEMGDTISAEKMKELTDLNPAMAEYFQLMADGTFMLTENAEHFRGVLDDLSYKGHYDQLEAIGSDIGALSNINSVGYNKLSQSQTSGDIQQTQLDYISQYGNIDENTMSEWQNDLADGSFTAETAKEIASAIGEIGDQTEGLEGHISSLKDEYNNIADTIAWTDYKDSIEEAGLDFEITERYAKDLEKAMAESGQQYDNLWLSARNLAIANQRLDRGLGSLANNLDDYIDKLKDSNRYTTEYSEALEDLKTDIADIFNTSSDLISDEFIEEKLVGDPEKLQQIADGNMDVINGMRQEVASEIFEQSIRINTTVDDTQIDAWVQEFNALIATFPDITTGVNVEGENEFIASLNSFIANAQMTRDQVNAMLGSMGLSAKLKTTYEPQEVEVPVYTTVTKNETIPVKVRAGTNPDGSPIWGEIDDVQTSSYTVATGTETVQGFVPVTAIETIAADGTSSGGGIDITSESPMSTSNNSGFKGPTAKPSASNVGGYTQNQQDKGGGGKESQPAEKVKETKHQEIVDRYKEVDDAIDDVADALEDVNKLTDRMYGKSHINGLKEQNRLLQEEIGLLHNKVAEAKAYLAVDREALSKAASEAGVSLNIDSAGNISNYTSEMNRLYNELAAAEQAWNASYQSKTQEDQQAYQENVLDPLNEKIDGLKEAIAQYDETRELIEDLENELDDKFYEWQDNNYEILHYTLEIEIELNDLELQEIEYYLDKIADDFYSMAEGLAYMNKQIPLWSDTLGDYETFYNGLNDAFAKGEISQAAYVEGLKESYTGIFDTLGALNELDDEMLHYYEDTLSAASDELATYTDHLEHLTGVLDHYKNIVELVNGEFDYDRIGTILEGQAASIGSELEVLKANYEMMLREKKAIEAAYADATAEEKEVYEAELKAITAALDEAQDEMLSKTEEWAEAMKAIMENTIAAAGKELEDAFTGGIGFDSLANSLERLNSFNDEYLTKTNQIYETQKLMRQAQQASDRTDNQASKIKLKNFMNETQQLQEKNKLSNLDLEIQQARYELLLAELALEEAQNAKATVRLQRDSEGNFGYVYTADLEAVTEREQALADAENELYNIGLNAANDYGQRRLELQQQLADELIALNERRNNGEFATDALYYAERDRIMAEYTDLFIAYSDQYTTALGVDAEIQKDAWIQAYDKMIDQTANWKDHTEEYLSNCEDAYSNWRDLVANESEQINDVLNGVEDNVKDIVNESKNLSNTLVSQVIPAINQELIAVRNVASAYASQRAQIMQLIVYYEQLCASIRAAIAAQAAMDNAVASNNSRYESGTVGGSGGGSGSGGGGGSGSGNNSNNANSLATEAQNLVKAVHFGDVKNDGSGWKKDARAQGYSEDAIAIANKAFNDSKPDSQQINQWDYFYDEALRLAGYDTGGYTGSFGPAGRLAVLHEKELVLNKEDTENFLAATDILRGISKVIDLEAAQSTYAAARLVSGTIGEAKEVLEQIVKIEASFPAVSDRNEIEAAFNNLINTASQYANRKR